MSFPGLTVKIGVFLLVATVSYSQRNVKTLLASGVKATPEMYSLYEMDVKHFYGLEDRKEFSSELKTKIFMQSAEYKSMYNNMLRQKNDMFNHTYYIKMGYDVGKYLLKYNAFAMNIRHLHYYTPGDLANVNYPSQKGILFFDDGLLQKANSTVVYVKDGVAIATDPLPIKLDANRDRFLFLATSENNALKIEEAKGQSIYIFFNPVDYKVHRFKYTQSFMVWSEKKDEAHRSFVSDGIRLVLADDKTGEIYYDRTYAKPGGSVFPMKKGTVPIRLRQNESVESESAQESYNNGNETKVSSINREDEIRSSGAGPGQVTVSFNDESTSTPSKDPGDPDVYTVVEQQPEFSGGTAALGQYLQKNLRYPAAAQRASVSGRVFVSFIVNKDGSLSDYKVLKGLGSGTDEEALRVIKGMPKWKPGKNGGIPVKCRFNLPINFTLE